jgi:hypothetical protein
LKVREEYLTWRKCQSFAQSFELAPPSFISHSSSVRGLRSVSIVLDDEEDLYLTGGFIDFVTSRYSNFSKIHLVTKKAFVRAFYARPTSLGLCRFPLQGNSRNSESCDAASCPQPWLRFGNLSLAPCEIPESPPRIIAELKVKPSCKSHRCQEVGSWFDVLLKWYILLNKTLGLEPSDIRKFLEGFYQTPYGVRWKLDDPTLEGDPRKCQQLAKLPGKLHPVHDSWDVFLDYFDNLAPSNLHMTENGIVFSQGLGCGWKKDSNLLTSEMVTDLLRLIDCVDHTTLTYDDLFVYRMHLLGNTIDFLLDDLLVDAKVTTSSTLKWSYFDQLVSYYIRFYLLKRHYAISDVDIQYMGIYFARHGYLYKIPVDQIVDIEQVDKFAYG